jgi:molybdopterin converting factor small subunit
MPRVLFTGHLRRYLDASSLAVPGASVREALEHVFAERPRLRGYVLDEQGRLRRHVTIYLRGAPIADRSGLGDVVGPADEIYVLQALSGG